MMQQPFGGQRPPKFNPFMGQQGQPLNSQFSGQPPNQLQQSQQMVPQGGLQTVPNQPFSLYQTMTMKPQTQYQPPGPPQFPSMMFHQSPQMPPVPPQFMMMLQKLMGGGMPQNGMMPPNPMQNANNNQGPMNKPVMGNSPPNMGGGQQQNPMMLLMKMIHDKQQNAMKMPQQLMNQKRQQQNQGY